LVVTGGSPERAEPAFRRLAEEGIDSSRISINGEPTVGILNEALNQAREYNPDLVIGFGGGSAMDTAKAISALIPNKGSVLEYLEVIGKGRQLQHPPVPCIAVPTTAGTGAEVTRNAVLKSEDHGVKVSLRSPLMYPRIALVDPELTISMPPQVTASTGMDALAQLLESLVSKNANPITKSLCAEGIKRATRSLQIAYHNGSNTDAREDMSLASLLSGITLTNAGLGAVHGIAGPLGGMCSVPHGAACAILLPFVVEINVRALEERSPESPSLSGYMSAARLLTGADSAGIPEAIQWLLHVCKDLKIPPLSQYGFHAALIPELAARSQNASSMKANPVSLTIEEIHKIIEKALNWLPSSQNLKPHH
jgi:alcohol dehydrogenase class IV